MIQERPSLPTCPYCGATLPYWPRCAPVHGCRTCLRPLVILPGTVRRPHYYRIHTLFGIVKILTALSANFVIAALGFGHASPSALVAMTIMVFFVHGSMDMADGILSLKTGIDRTWKRPTPHSASKLRAILKLAFGLLLLAGSALGLSTRACPASAPHLTMKPIARTTEIWPKLHTDMAILHHGAIVDRRSYPAA